MNSQLTKEQKKTALICGAIALFGAILLSVYVSIISAIEGLVITLILCLFVEYANRQNKVVRNKIRLGVAIFIAVGVLMMFVSPGNALSIDVEQRNNQAEWIIDGEPPYDIWINGETLTENYGSDTIVTDVRPGEYQYLAVTDATNETASTSIVASIYAFPIEILILIGVCFALLALSYYMPYAAFGAAALGGILVLLIAPDSNYDTNLRIVSGLIFLASLGGLYANGVER